MKMSMKKITPDMTIAEIIKLKPKALNVLMDYGLGCAHCELGAVETLEEGCKGHGLTEYEIKELVDLINIMK